MENIIIVESATFFVNRQDPTQVSYAYTAYTTLWRPVMLSTYAFSIPAPKAGEILYKLRGSDTRGAIVNVNNL